MKFNGVTGEILDAYYKIREQHYKPVTMIIPDKRIFSRISKEVRDYAICNTSYYPDKLGDRDEEIGEIDTFLGMKIEERKLYTPDGNLCPILFEVEDE